MSVSPEQPPAHHVDDSPTLGGEGSSTSATSVTVPPTLSTMAANHPYSTAFLLGAALTGSAVIGGVAARRAFGKGQYQRAVINAHQPAAPTVPSAMKGEYDSRLLKLEALVKDAQQANKRVAEQMVAIPQLVKGLERVQADLAQEQSAALKAQRAYWDQKFEVNETIADQVKKLGDGFSSLATKSDESLQTQRAVAQTFRSRITTDVKEMLSRLAAVEAEVKQLAASVTPPKPEIGDAASASKIAKPAEASAEVNEDEEEGGLDATQGDFCIFPPEPPAASSTTSAASSTTSAASSATAKASQDTKTSSSNRPKPSDRAETRSHQPVARLGVDESGEWKYRLDPATQGSDQLFGSHLKPRSIVLCRQSEKRGELGLPFLSSTTRMTYVYGPFVTGIVFNPEVDMVLLDGAWWRVTEDDGVYTVREKVAEDSL